MKILNRLLFVFLILAIISCKNEKAIELENFDFNTKVSTFISDKNKYKTYDNYYQIKSEVIGVDTIYDGEFIGSEKPVRIEYRKEISSSKDILAQFDNFYFDAINFATTLDGKIMVFNATISNISLKETQNFVENLNKKYGKSTKTNSEFAEQSLDIYKWQLKDRIITYTTVLKNDDNTLKIGINNKQIKNEGKEEHNEAYIFIIKKEYKEKVFGKVSSGDFVYLE